MSEPRRTLAELIAARDTCCRVAQAAPLLYPEAAPAVAFARAFLALPGWGTPPAATVLEFVLRLAQGGWAVIGAPGPPQPGDLWVKGAALGFVGALSQDQAYFSALNEEGERGRMAFADAECFLRLPCPTCDQQPRPGPGQPGRR